MTLDMANIGTGYTGIGAIIHVYQDVDHRAHHGPRIKVFPGNPGDGNATVVVVPTTLGGSASIKGRLTVKPMIARRALRFAELNQQALIRYWHDPMMLVEDLLAAIVIVD